MKKNNKLKQQFRLEKKFAKKLINNREERIEVTRNSHFWFFNVYFNHYIRYPMASFHHKMFKMTEDDKTKTNLIVTFRGSAKSTIFTLSYPIWSILGKQGKKFVIILGQTQRLARQHLVNIKTELESNQLLREDLGPFKEIEDEWGSYSLVIPKYGARITAASMEQTIRGMRHNQFRPDLIILDDLEDLEFVKTSDNRNKLYDWVTSEIIPAGDIDTRMIFVGNLLHNDSLLMRIKDKITKDELDGKFLEVPLIDENNRISWKGKFPDMKAVEKEKKKVANIRSWSREYLLRIVPEDTTVIYPNMIHYYDKIPDLLRDQYGGYAVGVDLAVSDKESANCTAMVSARLVGNGDNYKIYILPNPVNARMQFPEIIETMRNLTTSLGGKTAIELYIEEVAAQAYITQQLKHENFRVEGIKIHGMDKRTRLSMTANMIQQGRILFPKEGCKELLGQILDFGVEKYDDLCDAFTILILRLIEKKPPSDEGEICLAMSNNIWNHDDGLHDLEGPKKRKGETWGSFLDREDKYLYGPRNGSFRRL